MNQFFTLTVIFLKAYFLLKKPGGRAQLICEINLCIQQLVINYKTDVRCPALTPDDRIILGFLIHFIPKERLHELAIILSPTTLLKYNRALFNKDSGVLRSSKNNQKPGPKGPTTEVIDLVLVMKKKNLLMGYLRIAMQLNLIFDSSLDSNQVKRILDKYHRPSPFDYQGPSWSTFFLHTLDSLRSLNFSRKKTVRSNQSNRDQIERIKASKKTLDPPKSSSLQMGNTCNDLQQKITFEKRHVTIQASSHTLERFSGTVRYVERINVTVIERRNFESQLVHGVLTAALRDSLNL